MGQLHELLAVEGDLKVTANRAVVALKALFTEGSGRFVGTTKQYTPLEEGGEDFPAELVPLATDVHLELTGFAKFFGDWVDAVYQKEEANQRATADLTIGDKDFKGVPATALLNLEGKLAEIRSVLLDIPTNDPLRVWEWDKNENYYRASPDVRHKSQKVTEFPVVHKATDRHPAQIEKVTVDKRVGSWETVVSSGMLSKTDKQDIVNRVNEVLLAVRQARQRANRVEVDPDKTIAEHIFNYILG